MVTCVKCSGSMSEGFVIDQGDYGAKSVSNWHDNPPERHWYGLKTSKKNQRPIATYRCNRCGYLESYAR